MIIKCKNCDETLKFLKKGFFYCEKCAEIFKVEDDKQEQVKGDEAKEFVISLKESFKKGSDLLKTLYEKYCDKEPSKDDEDTPFWLS